MEAMLHSGDRVKPAGVKALSWLFLFGAIFMLGISIFGIINSSKVSDGLEEMGLQKIFVFVGVAFLFVLALMSGVGFVLGRPWGWLAGTFFFIYSIARNINASVLAAGFVGDPSIEFGARGPEYYVAKHAIRSVIHLGIYAYLFRPHVREYFGVESHSVARVVVIEVAICVALFIVGSVFGWS